MRIVYSEKVKNLFSLIEPYIEWNKFPPKLKDNAPDDIKEAEALYCKLSDREKKQCLENMGLI